MAIQLSVEFQKEEPKAAHSIQTQPLAKQKTQLTEKQVIELEKFKRAI